MSEEPVPNHRTDRRRWVLLAGGLVGSIALCAVLTIGMGVAFFQRAMEQTGPSVTEDDPPWDVFQRALGGWRDGPAAVSPDVGDGADRPAGRASPSPVDTDRADRPRRGGVLHLPGAEPTTLDPAKVRDVVSADYMYEIYSGLVTLSDDLDVVPDLASDWATSADGTVYTFTLRTGARFHDGEPVIAEDVRYGIERACDPATGSDVAGAYLDDIVGCTDKLAGRASDVRGVRVLGVDRVEITIDAPKSYFLAKLTYPTSFVVDRLQVETDPQWEGRPNGTGPFRVTDFSPAERIRLERHDGYHGRAAWLDAVEYDLRPINAITRYENGELDAAPVSAFDLARVQDPLNPLSDQVLQGKGDLGLTYIGFNVQRPPFDDVHVRRAFNLAVDKERVAEIALRGAVRTMGTILPPGMPGYDPDLAPYSYDPQAGRRALADSRYGGPEGLPALRVFASGGAGGSPSVQASIDTIEEALGVEIVVEQAPWDLFQEEVSAGRYGAWFLGWSADYADPQDFLDVLFHSESPLNGTGYANDEVDRLLEEARLERDEPRRLALYREAEALILSDAPWVPLFTSVDTWLVAPYVHGFSLPPIVIPRMADVWLSESR